MSSANSKSEPCLTSALPLNSLKPVVSSTVTDFASISIGCFASSGSANAREVKNSAVKIISLFIDS